MQSFLLGNHPELAQVFEQSLKHQPDIFTQAPPDDAEAVWALGVLVASECNDPVQTLKDLRKLSTFKDIYLIVWDETSSQKPCQWTEAGADAAFVNGDPSQLKHHLNAIKPILKRQQALEAKNTQLKVDLKSAAIHDPLTGIYNRGYLDIRLDEELAAAQRRGYPLTLLIIDLDGFKEVNDRLGHVKGDEVLREIAQLLKRHLRKTDLPFRYGGDEFVILLPEINGNLHFAVERLQESFQSWVDALDLEGVNLGWSIGKVTWRPGMGADAELLLKSADEQLHKNKSDKDIHKLELQISSQIEQLEAQSEQVHLQTALLNSIGELIVVTDVAGHIRDANQAFCQWCTQSLDTLYRQPLAQAVPALSTLFEQAQKRDLSPISIEKHSDLGGTLLMTPSEIKTKRGRLYGYVFVGSDVTELEQTHQRLKQIGQLLEDLNAESQLEPILQRILEEAVDLTPNADSGSVQLLSAHSDTLEFVAAKGWDIDVLREIKIPHEMDIHRLHFESQPAILKQKISDFDQTHYGADILEKFESLGRPKSSMIVPIKIDDNFIGKINLNNLEIENAFDEDSLQALVSFMPQVELAIRRATQRAKLETLTDTLQHNQEFLRQLNAETRIEAIFQLLLEDAVNAIENADSGSALLFNDKLGCFEYMAAVGWKIEDLQPFKLPRQAVFQESGYQDEPTLIQGKLIQQRNAWQREQQLEALELPRASISLPIQIQGETLGYFNIDSRVHDDAFSEQDLALVSDKITHIKLALLRVRDHEALLQHQRQLSQAFQLGQSLAQLSTIESVAWHTTNWAIEQYGYDLVGIVLKQGDEMRVVGFSGSDEVEQYVGKRLSLDITPSLVARALREQQTFCVNDVDQDAGYMQIDPRTQSNLVIPIISNGQSIGVLNLEAYRKNAFGELDLELASFLASQLSVAFTNILRGEALRESEAKFSNVFQYASSGIAVMDAQLKFVEANPQFQQMWGYSLEELIDLTPIDLTHPDDVESSQAMMEKLVRGDIDQFQMEKRYIKKNGELMWGFIAVTAVRDQHNTLSYIIPMVRDVTERKTYEAALSHRLAFETIVNSTSSRFISMAHEDLDGGIEQTLTQIGEFLGVDRAHITQLNNAKTMSRTHEWSNEDVNAQIDFMQELPTEYFSEWLKVLRSGKPIPIDEVATMPLESVTSRQLLTSQGVQSIIIVPLIQGVNLTGFLALEQVHYQRAWDEDDVSLLNVVAEIIASAQVRKRASLALQRSEERYRELVENITDALFTMDTDGTITFISSVIEGLTGYIPDEMIGKHYSDFIYVEDLTKAEIALRRVLNRELNSLEFRIVTKLGNIRWVRSTSRPFEKDGHIIGIRGVISNIHEHKQAEARESELQRQLEATAIETATMLSRTIDEKDPYTAGHCQRLARYAQELGQQLGLSDARLYNLKYAALLHDVGKIGVPEQVLNKAHDLDPGEWERMKQHVHIGTELVSGIYPLRASADIIAQHHEHWDGSGYPNQLKGEQILLEARILAVVDTFDAMTTDRPYRNAKSREEVLEQLEQGAGKQWDPKVINTFLTHFEAIMNALPARLKHSDAYDA